jgi:hypothetical protein
MADESTARRDPASGSPGTPPPDDEIDEAGREANRRRIIITSLLTPPAVMTLNARRAHAAASNTPSIKNPQNYQRKGKGG